MHPGYEKTLAEVGTHLFVCQDPVQLHSVK